jgi:hypothetical protein
MSTFPRSPTGSAGASEGVARQPTRHAKSAAAERIRLDVRTAVLLACAVAGARKLRADRAAVNPRKSDDDVNYRMRRSHLR